MPAVLIATQMGRQFKWRPRYSGFDGAGPEDRTLVINVEGDWHDLPGLNGNSVDMAAMAAGASIVRQSWIPESGTFPCKIALTPQGSQVTIQF